VLIISTIIMSSPHLKSEKQRDSDPSSDDAKKLHPVVWICLGILLYAALQTWVFPKVSFPTWGPAAGGSVESPAGVTWTK